MTSYDFSPLFRSTVGFDRLMRLLENTRRLDDAGNGYPPYNIELTGEDSYRITMAVAGFGEDDLTIEFKENSLVISGDKAEAKDASTFLHRGIASRSFRREFQLADHVKVVDAALENGLLNVDLVRELPEAMKPRRIEIAVGESAAAGEKAKKRVTASKTAA